MKLLITLFAIISFGANANYLEDNLRKETWNGVEVIWLEDDSYPVYDVSVYFHAGAYSDAPGKYGETQLAFDLLSTGTLRYKQKEILDSLEFYGASYQASVTHEFSSYNVSGLVKDAVPTMKMVCHMFRNATYPRAELKKSVKRMKTGLRNLPSNHSGLANRIFRKESLKGTGYENPVGGTLKSIGRISSGDLKKKIEFLNDDIKKRIYIKGPKEMKALKAVFENDCKWGKREAVVKTPKATKESRRGDDKTVYLAVVPKANQAQIRIGNFMTAEESSKNHEVRDFTSQFLGGGFTSRLMQEIRVARGLTYSIGSYASEQSKYGRKGISTFTKNETIVQTLDAIKEVLRNSTNKIKEDNFQMAKRYAKGSYLFGLESTSAFLSNLIYFDHVGREYEEIYEFPGAVDSLTKDQVKKEVGKLFDPSEQLIFVLGSKKLKTDLEKAGYKVKVLNYKKYL
ncbi:MAG: insulinase family protein [Bacteriovoracaceae bacterium]|nr:insulinase family protein [Bacteriovoracaceae bacterium]